MSRRSHLLLIVALAFHACQRAETELPAPQVQNAQPRHEPLAASSIEQATQPALGAPGIEGKAPLRVGGDVTAPVALKRVSPDFSSLGHAHVPSLAIVEATISETGEVAGVRMIKPVPPAMERLIVEAMHQWKFEPATLHGKPVPVYYTMTVTIHWR